MKKEVLAASAALAGAAAITWLVKNRNEHLETVGYVDIGQYLGKWYEIARFPHSFEKDCACCMAEYSMNEDGSIKILNGCIREGNLEVTEGRATIIDRRHQSKLRVQFNDGIFTGQYWIIALAPDYSYAMVGHPNRKYLWILNRTPVMDNQVYNFLLVQAAGKGFDVRKLAKTGQDCNL
ncbi:MAG TPA: lipocalin family protein [Mucilaginibacter sp.]|jgi:apolipoprotein D and lipocalin family protein|nr:lipocalin family protein [Mucilaginibacter sp.]